VAEQMLADAGLELVGRGTAQVINELPTSTWPSGRLLPRAVSTTGNRAEPVNRRVELPDALADLTRPYSATVPSALEILQIHRN